MTGFVLFGVLFFVALVLISYDIFMFLTRGVQGTLSWYLWTLSKSSPILPFAFGSMFGILAGHLLWQMGYLQ